MKYAIDIPNFGEFADARVTADVAREAEDAGWDAVWVWDHVWRDEGVPYGDPWILLAAIALATQRIRLGPMVRLLPLHHPVPVQARHPGGIQGERQRDHAGRDRGRGDPGRLA